MGYITWRLQDVFPQCAIKTADYAAGSDHGPDADEHIPVSTATGPVTITLPSIAARPRVQTFLVGDFSGHAGTHAITIQPHADDALGSVELAGGSDTITNPFQTKTMRSVDGGALGRRWMYW